MMEKISSFIKKRRVLLIFLIFFLLLLLQYQFLYLYHDDYGYASLSYAVDIGNEGLHYGISDILRFLWLHYLHWGGRVTSFFVECSLLRLGLPIYRLVQSIVVTLIFYLIYKIAKENSKIEDYKIAIFTVSLYGILDLMNLRDSFFWISASVNYVFPTLYFLALVVFMRQEKYNNKFIYFLQFLLVFLTAFSHEQTSAMLLFYLILTLIEEKVKNKKIKKVSIIRFIIALIGFALLLFCPGNNARKATSPEFYNLSIFKKLLVTIPDTITGVFSEYNNQFFLLFFFALAIVSITNIKNIKNVKNKILKYLIMLSTLSNIVIIIFSLFIKNYNYFTYFAYLFNNNIKYLVIVVLMLQLLLIISSFVIYFEKKDDFYSKLSLSAFAYITPMFISSYFPERSVIGFQLVMFIIIVKIIFTYFEKVKLPFLLNTVIVAVLIYSITNYTSITLGYYNNKKVNDYNDKVLLSSSKKIKSGKNIKEIKQKKFNNMFYAIDPPYIEGFEYTKVWIKKYYEIPQKVELKYE